MPKTTVLFICSQNSARSQIAEEYLRKYCGDNYIVESAGFEPAPQVNPLVIEVMREESIDLSNKQTQNVFELYKQGKLYDYVVTVCDESEDANCPIFPGITHRLHVPFPDPAQFEGSWEERISQTREVRNAIKTRLNDPDSPDFLLKV
jgi:arsenate reductase